MKINFKKILFTYLPILFLLLSIIVVLAASPMVDDNIVVRKELRFIPIVSFIYICVSFVLSFKSQRIKPIKIAILLTTAIFSLSVIPDTNVMCLIIAIMLILYGIISFLAFMFRRDCSDDKDAEKLPLGYVSRKEYIMVTSVYIISIVVAAILLLLIMLSKVYLLVIPVAVVLFGIILFLLKPRIINQELKKFNKDLDYNDLFSSFDKHLQNNLNQDTIIYILSIKTQVLELISHKEALKQFQVIKHPKNSKIKGYYHYTFMTLLLKDKLYDELKVKRDMFPKCSNKSQLLKKIDLLTNIELKKTVSDNEIKKLIMRKDRNYENIRNAAILAKYYKQNKKIELMNNNIEFINKNANNFPLLLEEMKELTKNISK